MKSISYVLTFLFTWLGSAHVFSKNLSETYQKAYEIKTEDAETAITELGHTTILFVPGFLSSLALRSGLVGYFSGARQFLISEWGLHPDRLQVIRNHSEGPSRESVPTIATAIAKASGPVILVGHSKGNLDLIATLLDRPDLKAKVSGMITIQAPFFGARLADELLASPSASFFFRSLFALIGGSMESLREFSSQASHTQSKMVEEISSYSFPVLNVASRISPSEQMTIPLIRPFSRWFGGKKDEGDGMVPTQSAIIPGLPHIILEGIDHTDTVVSWGNRFDQGRFMGALLKVLLEL